MAESEKYVSHSKERRRKPRKIYFLYFIIQFVNHKNDFFKSSKFLLLYGGPIGGSTKYEFPWFYTFIYIFCFFFYCSPIVPFFLRCKIEVSPNIQVRMFENNCIRIRIQNCTLKFLNFKNRNSAKWIIGKSITSSLGL